MNKSENINELAAALSNLQGEIQDVYKGSKGYGYDYADLSAVFEVIRPLLLKHGLSIAQPVGGSDNMISLNTILMHKSGQYIGSVVSIPVDLTNKKMNALQAAGSTITYMRRYCVCSILGLATTDDDGKAGGDAMDNKELRGNNNKQTPPPAVKSIPQAVKVEQYLSNDAITEMRHALMDLIMAKGIPMDTVEKWCAKFGVNSVNEFTVDNISTCNNAIEKRMGNKE